MNLIEFIIQMSQMIKIITLFCLSVLALASTDNFALLVSTDNEDINLLYRFINYYGNIDCQQITEIDVVWNRKTDFENGKKFAAQNSLKRPAYFYERAAEQPPFAFRIPKESTSQFYYRSFVDMTLTCEQLTQAFSQFKLHVRSGLSPLIGEKTSQVTVQTSTDLIGYDDNPNREHFQFIENITLVSRHLIELGASPEMAAYLPSENNSFCEEIRLNFIHHMLYEELRSIQVPSLYQSKFNKQNQSSLQAKKECINAYINYFGSCPVVYQRKNWSKTLFQNPAQEKILQIKKAEVERRIFGKQPSNPIRVLVDQSQTEWDYEQIDQSKSLQHIDQSTVPYELILCIMICVLLLINAVVLRKKSMK